jgi:colanic acid/amylovoran biosynthesis glycosyltransferase
MSGFHVGIVVWNFPVRSETFVLNHALGLASRGFKVSVVSSGPGPGYGEAELAEIDAAGIMRVNVEALPKTRFRKLLKLVCSVLRHPPMLRYITGSWPWSCTEMFYAHDVVESLRKVGPNAYHIHFGAVAGPLLKLGLAGKIVVSWHGYDSDAIPRIRGEGMYRGLFRSNVRHTANSKFLRARLVELGAVEAQVSIVPMGVDCDRFSGSMKRWNGTSPLKIVSVGRLSEVKGHRYLVQSVSELLDEGCALELRILGAGDCLEDLRAQIGFSGHSSKISLLGECSSQEVRSILDESHIFAMTGVPAANGQIETQGVVFAEAQSMGLPVIASRIGGVPCSIVDGKTGILCNPQDVISIKDAIRFFLGNPNEITAFGHAGRAFVQQSFSCASTLDAFERLYQWGSVKSI